MAPFVLIFTILALLALFAACSAIQARDDGALPTSYLLTDVIISLERTHCYGPCPVYKVQIHGDGRVRYEGHENVKVVGIREATIGKKKIVELLKHIYEIRFFGMRSRYESIAVPNEENGVVNESISHLSDQPTKIVAVRIGGYEKRVEDYYYAPKELADLSPKIDAAAGTDKWVK
jgi:hypothetical protein